MSQPKVISLEGFDASLADGATTEVWNVLTDEYFTGELIPGTRRVPLDGIGREAASLTPDAPITVYCSGPDCPQSKAAGEKLASLGFTNVRVFEGGLTAWKDAGRPVESADAEAAV